MGSGVLIPGDLTVFFVMSHTMDISLTSYFCPTIIMFLVQQFNENTSSTEQTGKGIS